MSLRVRVLVLILCVAVAASGAALVVLWAERQRDIVLADLGIEQVLVVRGDVPAGTPLAEAVERGLVAPADVMQPPSDALPAVPAEGAALVFRDRAYAGDTVRRARLADPDEVPSGPVREEGRSAVTVALGEAARGTSFLQPGARVAVLVTGRPASDGGTVTCVLLAEVEVLGVGGRAADASSADGDASAQLVTFDVDPATAVRLVQGDADGDLHLASLGAGGSPYRSGDCRSSSQLLED